MEEKKDKSLDYNTKYKPIINKIIEEEKEKLKHPFENEIRCAIRKRKDYILIILSFDDYIDIYEEYGSYFKSIEVDDFVNYGETRNGDVFYDYAIYKCYFR